MCQESQFSSDLPDMDGLERLSRWMQAAEPTQRDAVLTALRKIADTDSGANSVLGWLLMSGASRIAGRIRRFAEEIDQVVAGLLWIQICDREAEDDKYVAK